MSSHTSCDLYIHILNTKGVKTNIPSIAYIATQVRFALNSAATFSRTDTVTDSEYFYFLVIDLLDDPEEHEEVTSLLRWWNQQIFPTYISETRSIHKDSVISKIKERRRLLNDPSLAQQQDASGASPTPGTAPQVTGQPAAAATSGAL